jgi:hypothetical protein
MSPFRRGTVTLELGRQRACHRGNRHHLQGAETRMRAVRAIGVTNALPQIILA